MQLFFYLLFLGNSLKLLLLEKNMRRDTERSRSTVRYVIRKIHFDLFDSVLK